MTIVSSLAQKPPSQKDTNKVYTTIESFTVKSKFTRFIYQALFKPIPVSPQNKNTKKKVYKKLIQKPYSAFEGKIIRHINIETLDPFGFSIADTIHRTPNKLARAGNKVHIKSLGITIRNLLLIRQNQVFDSLLVKESERLVRSMGYVTDVSFFVKLTAKNSDSVDIYIRELDKWSIIPGGEVIGKRIYFTIKDNNFLGLGHESNNEFTWNHATGNNAYKLNYYVPNIRNTYINSKLVFGTEETGNYTRSITVDRPFFSPFAKWGAGVSFAQHFRQDLMQLSDSAPILQRFKFNIQDYWAGHATQLFKGNTEFTRSTNLITAIRFVKIDYFEKPIEAYDQTHFYSNEYFLLGSIGINTRRYVQDKYMFKFGVTEDVPLGKVISMTLGSQYKNDIRRIYLGTRISSGYYFPWGYLAFNCEAGTFMHSSQPEQGVFTAELHYATGLVEIGKWKFRQFAKPQLTIGHNGFVTDSLTLNEGPGIDGFNSPSLSGSSRLIFTTQTQSYAPWNFIGFRFGPFLTLTAGLIGDEINGFSNSKLYSKIGLGILIRNDHLVINTFQLSIAYFPSIPGNGQDIIKINSFQSTDFGFLDFEMGKPAIVVFQ
jgi:hypothetical protein